jgi:diketogulonate reductase-like aldo/keto reductase
MDVTFADGAVVPSLGIGTYRMGETAALREDEIATVAQAVDLGLRVIDTAEMYGAGGAERIVGAALKDGRRDRAFVVSKVLPTNASRRSAIEACERSLVRMQIDRIDLYLLHWRGATPLAETVDAFDRLQQDGKIARWGVSNFDLDDLQELHALPNGPACATDQVYYSVSHRGIEFDLVPWLAAHRMPAMAYCPLDEGRLAKDDTLAQIGRKHGANAAQVGLAWLLTRPGVIVIPKTSSLRHLRDNAAAVSLKLDADDLALIERRWPPPSRKQRLAAV